LFNRGIAWPRGSGEAALALCIALGVMLGLGNWAPGAFRDLETASLDLRFRIRGVRPPGRRLPSSWSMRPVSPGSAAGP